MGLAETAQLAVRINLEGNAAAGIKNLDRSVAGLGKSIGRVGKGFGQIGAGVARAGLVVGGAAVAGLGAAAKAAIDFEDAFAGVRKTVDEADLTKAGLSFDKLARSFRDLATEIPISAVEFARIGEAAGALGVKATDIETFTRTVSLLGVTTDLTADAAADSLGRIGTILKFTGKDYEAFADTLVNLGNKGASTESEIVEITKRFAAEGRAAGLATTQIAALASATASLGFAPERGGTALSRVFANMATNISLANSKGKAFASATGRSIKSLQGDLNKGKGLPIFLEFIKSLKGLSTTKANRLLKAAGITNTSDRTIFRTMSENLPFINEQLEIAASSTGALSTEATKKFDTVRSKLNLLKNNLIEAGITIGEGFTPALGRAAEKLSAFLKLDANKSALKGIGEDIGKAIDGIDWGKVLNGAKDFVGVLKGALSVTMTILETLNKLPTELKAAGAGFLALNKLSGGLIASGVGNVVGGIGETIARSAGSRLPGVGRLFAQPVFVTNFPPGLGLGGVGGGGATGSVGSALNLVSKVILVGMVAEVASQIAAPLVQFGKDLGAGLRPQGFEDFGAAWERWRAGADWPFGQKNAPEWAGGKPKPAPVPPKNTTGSPDDRQDRKDIAAKLTQTELAIHRGREQTVSTVIDAKAGITGAQAETKFATERIGANIQGTTRSSSLTNAAIIGGHIRANRPITNVNVNVTATNVTKAYTTQVRYGPGNGSSGQDSPQSHGNY